MQEKHLTPKSELAYSYAKKVYQGQIDARSAAKKMNEMIGFNESSASMIFANYKCLLEGKVFKRAFSKSDLDYFLNEILIDGGTQALANALAAVEQHIEYREIENGISQKSNRKIFEKYKAILEEPVPLSKFLANAESDLKVALKRTSDERLKRIARAPKKPSSVETTIKQFVRNPDVIAETLNRAQGQCERCFNHAPFVRRSDNTPYLEVHHKKRLADGGEDTLENTIALCPNCHRELHFGI